MKITVRLYRQTDIDLIGLVCADGVSVSKELKKVLVSFVRGLPYGINLNPEDVSDVIMSKKQVQLQFYLEEKDYMDVINWLKTLRPRQRNSFLKNLLRSSLPCPYLYMYQTDSSKVADMINYIKTFGMKGSVMSVPLPVLAPATSTMVVTKPKRSKKASPTPVATAPIIPTTPVIPVTPIVSKTPEQEPIVNPASTYISEDEPVEIVESTNDSVNQDEEDMLFNALFNM